MYIFPTFHHFDVHERTVSDHMFIDSIHDTFGNSFRVDLSDASFPTGTFCMGMTVITFSMQFRKRYPPCNNFPWLLDWFGILLELRFQTIHASIKFVLMRYGSVNEISHSTVFPAITQPLGSSSKAGDPILISSLSTDVNTSHIAQKICFFASMSCVVASLTHRLIRFHGEPRVHGPAKNTESSLVRIDIVLLY